MTQDVPTMKVWWVLSVILVTLMLGLLVFAWTGSTPSPLHAISVVLVPLWAIVLIYFVFGRR
jgi:hypothetical protein